MVAVCGPWLLRAAGAVSMFSIFFNFMSVCFVILHGRSICNGARQSYWYRAPLAATGPIVPHGSIIANHDVGAIKMSHAPLPQAFWVPELGLLVDYRHTLSFSIFR